MLTELESATIWVTVIYSNQLNYNTICGNRRTRTFELVENWFTVSRNCHYAIFPLHPWTVTIRLFYWGDSPVLQPRSLQRYLCRQKDLNLRAEVLQTCRLPGLSAIAGTGRFELQPLPWQGDMLPLHHNSLIFYFCVWCRIRTYVETFVSSG